MATRCTCITKFVPKTNGDKGLAVAVEVYDTECPSVMHAIQAELDFHPNWKG